MFYTVIKLSYVYVLFWHWILVFYHVLVNKDIQGGICRGKAGELPPHWIWPSLPLVRKGCRGNGKGEGGKGKGGGDHLPYFPPLASASNDKYHPEDIQKQLCLLSACHLFKPTLSFTMHLFCGVGHEKRRGEHLKWSLAFRLYIGSFPCAQLPGPVHTARLGRVCPFNLCALHI